jgi:hypothetical protein
VKERLHWTGLLLAGGEQRQKYIDTLRHSGRILIRASQQEAAIALEEDRLMMLFVEGAQR